MTQVNIVRWILMDLNTLILRQHLVDTTMDKWKVSYHIETVKHVNKTTTPHTDNGRSKHT